MIHKCAVIFISAVLLLLTVKTSGDEKFCRLRENLYSIEIWNFWSGYYCYNYTNSYRLNFTYKVIPGSYKNHVIPIVAIDDDNYFSFHYKDPKINYLENSFKSNYFFEMWKDCCREAEYCCENEMTNENVQTEEDRCPAIWDGWTCFSPAEADTVEERVCSKQAYSTSSNVCELNSQKVCFTNGTWNQKTDYEVCAIASVLRKRHNFNVLALSVATVLSFPAVIIFFSLRSLRKNLRCILHRNLILIIIVRSLLTIMSKRIVILDALDSNSSQVMEDNSIACRVLAFFENAAKNGMYACMLADGYYLHKLIVRVFAKEPNLIYIYLIVGLLSFVPSIAWAVARTVHEGKDCWMVDETNDQWIVDGFRIAIIATNFLLLVDIVRVMVMKMKKGNTSQQTLATLRATLFLIPLFGVHIIIITNRNMVPDNTCKSEDIYYYVSYIIESLQGIMVSFLFCYINSEVRKELKNVFRKKLIKFENRFGSFFHLNDDLRRTTAATYVTAYE